MVSRHMCDRTKHPPSAGCASASFRREGIRCRLSYPVFGSTLSAFQRLNKGCAGSTVHTACSFPPGRGHATDDFVVAKPCNRTSLLPSLLSRAQTTNKKAAGLTPVDDDHDDDSHATDDHRRWLGATAVDGNTGSDGELTFMLSGWVLLSVAVGNYFLSRWSEIRLLRKAGCTSTQDYHTRLCVIEKTMIETKVGETGRGGGGGVIVTSLTMRHRGNASVFPRWMGGGGRSSEDRTFATATEKYLWCV